MENITPKIHQVKTKDGLSIALWQVDLEVTQERPIFLTHGTFSNKKVCMGIASYLAEQGYQCWIMEWRNHGDSTSTSADFNFETIAYDDCWVALEYIRTHTKKESLDAVVHSAGGICLTLFLLQYPHYQKYIKSMTMFATQAFGAAYNWSNYLKIYGGKLLGAALGYIPAQKTGLGEHDEPYSYMKQWFDWNLQRRFLGTSGENYEAAMASIQTPVLSICAKGDHFIAPRAGCEKFLKAFQNQQNKLLFCAQEAGFREDYSHSRIILSQNSKKEIWPVVVDWLQKAGA